MNGKREVYKVIWQYMYHHGGGGGGGKAQYKKGDDKENIKPCSAPGTKLTECKATIHSFLS